MKSGEIQRANAIAPIYPIALSGLTLATVSFVISQGITLNQALALTFTLSILTVWFYDKFKSVMLGLAFFISKPFWIRLAFGFDYRLSGEGGFDLLGITPALIFAALIIFQVYSRMASGQKICPDKSRMLLMGLSVLSLVSIFFPSNTIVIGLGGFERNILPNMMILFLLADIVTEKKQVLSLVKTLLAIGLISVVYGIGQFAAGLYPWEKAWFQNIAYGNGLDGWLTIGLRGIEFRLFSFFFSYMDFFFTNVLIYALAVTFNEKLEGHWRKFRILYIGLWYIVLLLSLERMPLIMTLAVTGTVYYSKQSKPKRRRIVWAGIVSASIIYGSLTLAGPFLKSTGASTLIRLAELANPLKANSINARVETKWGPALETIKTNPLGVGIGFGSQTRADGQASESGYYVQPHNELIQKTLETGVIGGLIFLFLTISLFRDFKLSARSKIGHISMFGTAMIAGTIAFWICGLVNLPFSGTSGLIYWALAGTALGLKALDDSCANEFSQNNDISHTAIGQMEQKEICNLS